MKSEIIGRYVVVEVNSDTTSPHLQVQYWPDEEHKQQRDYIADVKYLYGDRKAYNHAMKTANQIAAMSELLAALKTVIAHCARIDPHHQYICDICSPAIAAIAKAEGE